MGVTTALPIGSLYNMSKFALEGLIEGLYYELKPLNISLHLIEQGGSSGNNFSNSIIWNTKDGITDYDAITAKTRQLMENHDPAHLDDPQTIVDAINDLATGKNKRFRVLLSDMGNDLMKLRNSVPIEEFLDTVYKNFR
jgi:NAD(P)-dependent dehydrogenase (short-subunit alcohol dehydrogenase family)